MIQTGDAGPSVDLKRFLLPLLVRHFLSRGPRVVHVLVPDGQKHEDQRVQHHDAGEREELVPLRREIRGRGENDIKWNVASWP